MDVKAFKDAVDSGVFDSSIDSLIEHLTARQGIVRRKRTVGDYSIGDKVKFNSLTGTRYMIGVTGIIVAKKQKKVVVRPDVPVGRFGRLNPITKQLEPADVTCPIGILDLV